MYWLALVIVATLTTSFICSLFEALILSSTVAEIEALKKSRPRVGEKLETIKGQLEQTISAILTLNTIANSLGSVLIGVLGARLVGDRALALLTVGFGIVLLVGAEVLPKNMGVVYRRQLQPYVVYPLWYLRRALVPVTYLCNLVVGFFIRPSTEAHRSDEEIILLAERGAQQGTLSKSESLIIANALALDDVRVSEIMTPRTVVTALRKSSTVSDVFREFPNLPFGRMPVYGRNLDDIAGLVRPPRLIEGESERPRFDPSGNRDERDPFHSRHRYGGRRTAGFPQVASTTLGRCRRIWHHRGRGHDGRRDRTIAWPGNIREGRSRRGHARTRPGQTAKACTAQTSERGDECAVHGQTARALSLARGT